MKKDDEERQHQRAPREMLYMEKHSAPYVACIMGTNSKTFEELEEDKRGFDFMGAIIRKGKESQLT